MTTRLALACALLLALLVAPAQASAPPAALTVPTPLLDPPGEALIEPPFANRGLELQARSGATNGLCRTLNELGDLPEPRADDVVELQRWVTKYYANIQLFDPSGRVTDPETGDEERIPRELVRAVDQERRAMYAYRQRVAYAKLLVEQDQVLETELQPRLDHAFVTLARSDFDSAHRMLLAAGRRYC